MLEVIGLACSRNDVVLFSNLSFQVAAGVAVQLRAANGSGKTTLLKTIAGLLPAAVGKIAVHGSLIFLGHNANLHPTLSARENLAFLSTLTPSNSKITNQQLDQALAFCNLTQQRNTPCAELSAGQRQRVNLARLYLSAAKLWLLDEPFANLDQTAQKLVLQLCAKHLSNTGALLVASHHEVIMPEAQLLDLEKYA